MSNHLPRLSLKIKWLLELGLSPLPVAPKQNNKLFSGKNPSYLDANGIPHLISHSGYLDGQPTAGELSKWFANPQNGIGCLGSKHYIFLDFDCKHFGSQEEFDAVLKQWEKRYSSIKDTYCDQTQSDARPNQSSSQFVSLTSQWNVVT